jgi:acetylornithine deacetylase/succinyl-diaminopimelate desuccinylase-like protein
MAPFSGNSAFSRVTALASLRPVHAAFAWLHGNPKTIMDWQAEIVAIPAPPFGEQARSKWLAARFAEAGLSGVETDELGNVFGWLPAASLPPESTGPVVVLSAHLDTVFPVGTPLHPVVDSDRLQAPGACDNGAGAAGMLAIAQALVNAKVALAAPLIFLGNVGEEGEGDLRGMRHLYQQSALAGRVSAHIVLDGAGADSAVTQALGSRRYRVAVTGPGGHSFTDAGTPNPITALVSALAVLAETQLPEEPRTTLNLGTIHGGTSVNSIPESAQATIDFRSTSSEQLLRLEVALHRAVEDAVEYWNAQANSARRATARRFTAAGSSARRRPPSGPAHRAAPGLDRRQHSALAWSSGALDRRGRRGRRRAHAGRVVLRQGPRNWPEAGAAADADNDRMGRRTVGACATLVDFDHARVPCPAHFSLCSCFFMQCAKFRHNCATACDQASSSGPHFL